MNKFLNYNFLIRLGLGTIFIANGLAAFFAPAEFVELVSNSFVAHFLPVSPETFVGIGIALNDSIVGLLLIVGIATRRTAIWAMLWLLGAIAVIGIELKALEDLGLLVMAGALALGDKSLTKNT